MSNDFMFVILVLCRRVKWFYVNACEDINLDSVFLLGNIWWPWASVVYLNLFWSSSNHVRHPCPNNNSVVIIRWLGWVSHIVSWLLWTLFATTGDVSFCSSSRSKEMQHIWGKIQIYYFWNRDCYRAVGFRNLTVPGEVPVKLFLSGSYQVKLRQARFYLLTTI